MNRRSQNLKDRLTCELKTAYLAVSNIKKKLRRTEKEAKEQARLLSSWRKRAIRLSLELQEAKRQAARTEHLDKTVDEQRSTIERMTRLLSDQQKAMFDLEIEGPLGDQEAAIIDKFVSDRQCLAVSVDCCIRYLLFIE